MFAGKNNKNAEIFSYRNTLCNNRCICRAAESQLGSPGQTTFPSQPWAQLLCKGSFTGETYYIYIFITLFEV